MENVAITTNETLKKPTSQVLKEVKKLYCKKNKVQIIEYITKSNKTHPEVVRKAQKKNYEKKQRRFTQLFYRT